MIIPPRLLMCARHWQMVPPEMQAAVLRHYRPGQERRLADRLPSPEYVAAAKAAIAAVARAEGGELEGMP
jgi:hypothetical protein